VFLVRYKLKLYISLRRNLCKKCGNPGNRICQWYMYMDKNGKLSLSLINKALCHEDECGSGGTAPLFLILVLDQGDGQLHVPITLLMEKNPRKTSDRRLPGPQVRSGHCREMKILALSGLESWSSSS
jgi:hypothetical protein